jgi:hypothetical protein
MPVELGAGLSELLGLRLVRAFHNLESDWERLRVVEYVEALNKGRSQDWTCRPPGRIEH